MLIILTALFNTAPEANASTQAPAPTRYIVFIGKTMFGDDWTNIFKSVLTFSLKEANPGDSVGVYHGITLKEFASFTVPTGEVFEKNPRARALRMAQEIARFKVDLLDALRPAKPGETAKLEIWKALDFAGTHLAKPGENVRIIIAGDPFFSEGPAQSPESLAAAGSVLSANGREGILKGATVHVGYLRDRIFSSNENYVNSAKFLSAFCESRGAVLVTYCPSVDLALERAKAGESKPFISSPNFVKGGPEAESRANQRPAPEPPASIDLGPIRRETVTTSVLEREDSSTSQAEPPPIPMPKRIPVRVQTEPPIVPVAPANAIDDEPRKQATSTASASSMVIFISWAPDIDLDLYVRPDTDSFELSYKAARSGKGRLFASSGGEKYEWTEIYAPVDLRTCRAWVNYFKGWTKSASGLVTISYKGKAYHSSFSFPAKIGDHGKDFDNRSKSKNWVELDLARIIGSAP